MAAELARLLCDRRLRRSPAVAVILILLAINVAVYLLRDHMAAVIAQNAQSGRVAVRQPANANDRVRGDESYGQDPAAYWSYIPDAARQAYVAVCGTSQLINIADQRPGDETVLAWLDEALAPEQTRAFGLMAPDLCNEEALFLLTALVQDPHTTPRVFVYAAFFDKLRAVDLRPGYQDFLRRKPELQAAWRQLADESASRFPLAAEKMRKTLETLQQHTADNRESFETGLRDSVGAWVPVVGQRRELNQLCQMGLYGARNMVLHIRPSTKRPLIQSRYDLNRQFLELLVELGRQHSVVVALYINPFNPLPNNPYVPQEYENFKQWLSRLATERRIPFANLENAVPSSDWGTLMGEPDFNHFNGAGHRLTAQALLKSFGAVFTGKADTREASR